MSIHQNLSREFVALPTRRPSSFAVDVARVRRPSPRLRAVAWEAVDVAGNLAALGTLLCAIVLWCLALSPGAHL